MILLFWLLTVAWLFERDLWPQLRPGEPPPFVINLADEAQRNAPPLYWNVFRNGKKIGRAKTSIRYHEPDDSFEMQGQMVQLDLGLVVIKNLSSMYRVTRGGQLREISADLALAFGSQKLPVEIQAHVDGPVRDQRFHPRCRLDSPFGAKEIDMDPIEIRGNGSVLNPLHPVKRVLGLRLGQRWQMTVVDPLGDVVATVLGTNPSDRSLMAEVLGQTRPLLWDGEEWPCLVIDYRGNDRTARTWVRESDGAVLRQEATTGGEELIMERDWLHALPPNFQPARFE
jgi:hypothetical protein